MIKPEMEKERLFTTIATTEESEYDENLHHLDLSIRNQDMTVDFDLSPANTIIQNHLLPSDLWHEFRFQSPANKWQRLKQLWAPDWFIARYPVKMQTINCTGKLESATCGTDDDGNLTISMQVAPRPDQQ